MSQAHTLVLSSLDALSGFVSAGGLIITRNGSLVPSQANALLQQLIGAGLNGPATIADNNTRSGLSILSGHFLIRTIEELEALVLEGGDLLVVRNEVLQDLGEEHKPA